VHDNFEIFTIALWDTANTTLRERLTIFILKTFSCSS